MPIVKAASQKRLGLNLDTKLTFNDHINENIGKAIIAVGLLRKLQYFLRRSSLLTIYISFVRLHLDYGDVIYDQTSNATFSSKVESMQFNAALAITGVNRDSVPEKLYQGLEPEYLHDRRWMRRLCLFYKVLLNKVPKYIYRFILPFRHSLRNPNLFTSFTCRTDILRILFFRVS